MIAQKIKGKKIRLIKEDSNEIESYTMLHLNADEADKLRQLAVDNKVTASDGVIYITYETKDLVDQYWKELCASHLKDNKNIAKIYKLDIEGTSILVRDPSKHIIRIAFKQDNNGSINKCPISNSIRDAFFADCKRSLSFVDTGKYLLTLLDPKMYEYWSEYMNKVYLNRIEAK